MVNPDKKVGGSTSLVLLGHERKVKVVDGGFFAGQSPIPSRSMLDVRRYLGVDFKGVATVAASRVDLGMVFSSVTKAV